MNADRIVRIKMFTFFRTLRSLRGNNWAAMDKVLWGMVSEI
jgi:hypothetical protein